MQQAGDGLVIREVKLPKGWSRQEDGRTLCPACSDKLALARLTRLEVPKPDENRAKMIKDIEKGGSGGVPFVEKIREELLTEPLLDVRTTVDGSIKTEISVQAWRDGRLLIQSTQNDAVKLDLKHNNFKLGETPPFMDARLVRIVQGLLATVQVDRGDDVPKGMVVMPLDDSFVGSTMTEAERLRLHEALSLRPGRDANMNSGLTNQDMEAVVRERISALGEALKAVPLVAKTRAMATLVTQVTEGDPDADIIRKGMSDPATLQALAEALAKKDQS
jgi:hypothetical protein